MFLKLIFNFEIYFFYQEPIDMLYNNSTSGTNPSHYINITSSQQQAARRILAAGISEDERRVGDVRRCLQLNDRSQALPASPVKSPGAFTEIYVRLYENFAQVIIYSFLFS